MKLENKSYTPLLSLCMPTNGISEWVFPSLDSIYEQGVDESLYEVVIMDNGDNEDFQQRIRKYERKYSNLRYYHTSKALFLSEPESYRMAQGELIKFINHRNVMRPGSVQYFLDFCEKNYEKRPIIYFTNGMTEQGERIETYNNFGAFIEALGVCTTWSSGMALWRENLSTVFENNIYNELFPHTNFLFDKRNSSEYIIDGTMLWDEIIPGKKPKGNYDLFYAFAFEFPFLLVCLMRDGDLTAKQYTKIRGKLGDYIAGLYLDYVVRKRYCSYDLSSCYDMLPVFYSVSEIRKNAVKLIFKRGIIKITSIFCKLVNRR